MTRRRLAERAVHMIMASRPKVVGAVLNRVNFDRNKSCYFALLRLPVKSYYGTHTSSTSTGDAKGLIVRGSSAPVPAPRWYWRGRSLRSARSTRGPAGRPPSPAC